MISASFSILVSGSPSKTQAHLSAIRFLQAAVKLGHSITNVFFYQDAVSIANRFICLPEDELQLTERWVELAKTHQFELQICIAAANRRGVINEEEARLNGKQQDSLQPGFAIVGLGQLASVLSSKSNRFIHFR